jgi:crotonobetainyl-CoA:carnitine CoA-transferase CaiB-like acyl-CoA transferase
MLSYQAAYFLASNKVPNRQGRGHDSIPTYRAFTCGDGVDVVVTANTERMWSGLCAALGRPDLVNDERFRTNDSRYANRRVLWPILEACFQAKPSAAWVKALLAAEVPAAVVNTLDLSLSDPQVLHRNMVLAMTGPNGEQLRVAGNPIKFAGESEPSHVYPPLLGADNRSVLSEQLGLSEETIDQLELKGAFGTKARTSAAHQPKRFGAEH